MIWVLTEEFNDYDQHGAYYVKAWPFKPGPSDLLKAGVPPGEVSHVLQGGGRHDSEYSWYHLNEEKP